MNIIEGNGEYMPIANADEEHKEDSTLEVVPPYIVDCTVEGVAPILFHAWDCSDVESKGKAAKGSQSKKKDNVDSYVYRCPDGTLGLPNSVIKATIVAAARWAQDPRSPRKSAIDLFKAGIFVTPVTATFGKKQWDFLDKRRVTIQRNGITRVRPALLEGWKVSFTVNVIQPEYIHSTLLHECVSRAGQLVGFCDFRPEFGRFQITSWKTK